MKEYVAEKIESPTRAAYVEDMFGAIAPRYDLLNRLMTGGQDRRWRAIAVAETRIRPGGQALDVATGTGDLAFALARVVGPGGRVVGVDFSDPMLDVARDKVYDAPSPLAPEFRRADALALPFDDGSFDAATIGFGLRNVTDVPRALAEMRRVLRPDGRMVCLEVTRPRVPLLAAGFYAYFNNVVPVIGAAFNGAREAYTYLPTSLRYFPDAPTLRRLMLEAGFAHAHMRLLNLGTIAVHVGRK
jgi:demethylmenaquinone methyltransferase/2-methoxy-6-polyprenyl-1,4-benzoquinol methylase